MFYTPSMFGDTGYGLQLEDDATWNALLISSVVARMTLRTLEKKTVLLDAAGR